MILELKIQNFLSFKDEVIFSFEATSDTTLDDYYVVKQKDGTRILKMTMVYGANASGKSNLIKAFEFIIDFVHKKPDQRQSDTPFVPYMFDACKEEAGRFELLFYVQNKKYKYELTIDEKTVYEEKLSFYPSTQPAVIFSREYDAESNVSIVKFGSKIKISEQAKEAIQLQTLNDTSVFAARTHVNVAIPELDLVNNWFKEQYLSFIDPYMDLTRFSDNAIKNSAEIKKHTLQFLKEADFNITDVIFKDKIRQVPESFLKMLDTAPISDEEKSKIKKEKTFHFEETIFTHKIVLGGKEEFHSLSEERQSKGTIRFYGLSAPFFHAIENNAFLPIDKIGSALHPLLVIHFLKEFLQKSKQAQLLFTTHNLSILNEKDILRKDAIQIYRRL